MNSENKDKKLLEHQIRELLINKEQKAISLIYKNYSTVLYGLIYRIVKSDVIAQEVLQDTFLKIWKNAHQYDPNKARLFTWFSNIARNTAIDKVRSAAFKKEQQTGSIENITNTASLGKNETKVEDSGLKKIVNSLDEKHRVLIDMVYFQGYSHRDIEKELNIPLGTVKSRIRKALTDLRQELGSDFTRNLISIAIIIISQQYLMTL